MGEQPLRKIELLILDSLGHLFSVEIECEKEMSGVRIEDVKRVLGRALVSYRESSVEREETKDETIHTK